MMGFRLVAISASQILAGELGPGVTIPVDQVTGGQIAGLFTVGDSAGPRAEIGTNAAGESGIRLYSDATTETVTLDSTTGAATFRGAFETQGTDGSNIRMAAAGGSAFVNLQPPSQPGADFRPAEMFTESNPNKAATFTIRSPHEFNSGDDQASITMEGSDGAGPGSYLGIHASQVSLDGTLAASGSVGTVPVSFTNVTSHSENVAFPKPFSAPPIVVLNIGSFGSATARWTAYADNITPTGFRLSVANPLNAAASSWSAVPVTWVAIGT
jgi:H-type lectin domain